LFCAGEGQVSPAVTTVDVFGNSRWGIPSTRAADTRTVRLEGNEPNAVRYDRTTPTSRVGNQNCFVGNLSATETMFIRCCRLCRSPLSCHLKYGERVRAISDTMASVHLGWVRDSSLFCNAFWVEENPYLPFFA
jgi:hypothetical protein